MTVMRSSGRPVPPGGGGSRLASGSRARRREHLNERPEGSACEVAWFLRRTYVRSSQPRLAGVSPASTGAVSHHQLCVVDSDGERLLQLRVTHDVAGLAELEPAAGTLR